MLRLRQKAGGCSFGRELLLRLMADSISTFCVLFRHALILAGEHRRVRKAGSDRGGARAFRNRRERHSIPCSICGKKSVKPRRRDGPVGSAAEYMNGIDVVIHAVDRMKK